MGFDGSMSDIVVEIGGLESLRGKLPPPFEVATFRYNFSGRCRIQKMFKYGAVVYFRFREFILGLHHFEGFFSLIWIFMENSNKIVVLYD